MSRVERFVDALVRDRRPRRWKADADEAHMLQTAAALRAGRPDTSTPDPGFVDDLARRLRRAADEELSPAGRRRRRFLAASGIAAAAAVTGVGADRLVAGLTKPAPGTPQSLVPDDATWQPVARVADIPATGVLRFTRAGVTGFLVKDGASIGAMSAVCTHMGCLLATDAAGIIRCPCHDASFTHSGTPQGGYDIAPLPRLSARVTGDDVEVLLPRSG